MKKNKIMKVRKIKYPEKKGEMHQNQSALKDRFRTQEVLKLQQIRNTDCGSGKIESERGEE